MRQIVKDWCDYYEDKRSCEKSAFFTLFMEKVSKEEIRQIYQYFPFSLQLIERLENFLFGPFPKIENKENIKDELKKIIINDFEERSEILYQLPSFQNFLSNPEFIFISDETEIKKLILDDIWSQNFIDFTSSQRKLKGLKIYELHNALYGITNDFDYRLYLFIPFLNINYSGTYLFKFKRLGGVYAISDNKVYYSFSNNQLNSDVEWIKRVT